MREVGTISWFLLPFSTCGVCAGQVFLDVLILVRLGSRERTYGGENLPVLGSEVAQVSCVQFHGWGTAVGSERAIIGDVMCRLLEPSIIWM